MQQAEATGGSKQAAVASKQGSLHGKVHDKVRKWREMRNACLWFSWYSVARCKQQEKSRRQVGSARDSPLAFCPVASQPRRFSDFPKNGEKSEMRVFHCYCARSRAASSRRNTHSQVWSAKASPIAFSLISSQPRRFSPQEVSPKERKLDPLKMNSKGSTNEAPTCAVPMHATHTNSLWQGWGR